LGSTLRLPPRGDVRVSGRANTRSWVYRRRLTGRLWNTTSCIPHGRCTRSLTRPAGYTGDGSRADSGMPPAALTHLGATPQATPPPDAAAIAVARADSAAAGPLWKARRGALTEPGAAHAWRLPEELDPRAAVQEAVAAADAQEVRGGNGPHGLLGSLFVVPAVPPSTGRNRQHNCFPSALMALNEAQIPHVRVVHVHVSTGVPKRTGERSATRYPNPRYASIRTVVHSVYPRVAQESAARRAHEAARTAARAAATHAARTQLDAPGADAAAVAAAADAAGAWVGSFRQWSRGSFRCGLLSVRRDAANRGTIYCWYQRRCGASWCPPNAASSYQHEQSSVASLRPLSEGGFRRVCGGRAAGRGHRGAAHAPLRSPRRHQRRRAPDAGSRCGMSHNMCVCVCVCVWVCGCVGVCVS
jgi:hypothetical protein